MLTRPFAPFRVRPLKSRPIQRQAGAPDILALASAEEGLRSIRAERKQLRGGRVAVPAAPRIPLKGQSQSL